VEWGSAGVALTNRLVDQFVVVNLHCVTTSKEKMMKKHTSIFFRITQYIGDTHNAHTLIPMNTHTQTLPLGVSSKTVPANSGAVGALLDCDFSLPAPTFQVGGEWGYAGVALTNQLVDQFVVVNLHCLTTSKEKMMKKHISIFFRITQYIGDTHNTHTLIFMNIHTQTLPLGVSSKTVLANSQD
jgi:ribosomal protein S3AE